MDLTFKTEKGRFNYRVGAIIIQDGKVLVVKNSASSYYYSVGGRVHYNETCEEAVKREVREEVGIEMDIDRLDEYVVFPRFFQTELLHLPMEMKNIVDIQNR